MRDAAVGNEHHRPRRTCRVTRSFATRTEPSAAAALDTIPLVEHAADIVQTTRLATLRTLDATHSASVLSVTLGAVEVGLLRWRRVAADRQDLR